MRLPEKDGELDLEQICKMVDAYLASGMNYFDTAYMYCGGKSESIVKKCAGRASSERKLYSDNQTSAVDDGRGPSKAVTAFFKRSARAHRSRLL